MVLHHRIEPAQVIGGTGRTDLMAVQVALAVMGGLAVAVVLGLVVVVLMVLVLVWVALGSGRRGPECGDEQSSEPEGHGGRGGMPLRCNLQSVESQGGGIGGG